MKCKDCQRFQSYRSVYGDNEEPEDQGFCGELRCDRHVNANDTANLDCFFPKAENTVKPFLSGHIKFESRGREIVIVPNLKGVI